MIHEYLHQDQKKIYDHFLWTGFNCLDARATSSQVPRNPWYSFYGPQKYERLSRSWSHTVVLNTGPLD